MKSNLIARLKNEYDKLKKELDEKRFSLGEADSSKESRFPTQRVELESRIKYLEDKVYEFKQRIEEIETLPHIFNDAVNIGNIVTIEYDNEEMTFLLVLLYGNYTDNVLSINSPLGKAILNRKVADDFETVLDGTNKMLKIVGIK